MGLFGKSKEDTSQDQQLKNVWKWIEQLNKNQAILTANNDIFVANEKNQRQLNQQYATAINSLVEKDKVHDQKDREIEAVIKGLKDMSQAVETATTETEG